MKITILNKEYDINLQELNLNSKKLKSLPAEISNLIHLKGLYLYNNQLQSLPSEIGNLINLQNLYLSYNQLQSLPAEILKIKNILKINDSSYDINNLNIDNEILILSNLIDKLNNFPINTKEIWLKSHIKNYDIKLPFDCKIKYY